MNYKVCILAGGLSNEMGNLTKNIHSSLLPVNSKAAISYIIEKFPKDIEIVLALGHKKESVMDYLNLAHGDRKFTFIQSENYIGPGTGPGYALLECKQHLQCPFIFATSDTLVLEGIPEPKENWFGIAPVKETERYCTVKIKNNLIYQLDDKIKTDNKFAFIGLAGVYDYQHFWDALESNKDLIQRKIQVSNGFKKLIEHKLAPVGFTWFDTGTLENYKETNKNFSGGESKFDFSKTDEFIYFVDNKVIKYFADADITAKRCKRAEYLKGLCPKIEAHKGNFYSYKKIDGNVLYNVMNTQLVKDFLHWAKLELWKRVPLSKEEEDEFKKACFKFYHDKTYERIQKFYTKKEISDGDSNINGVHVPPLQELLNKLDWEYICDGVPVKFHGDLQFDNVLVTRDEKSQLPKFVLLDWRHEFGGVLYAGDIYYDLAKTYGGLIISYQLIKEGLFSFDMSGSSAYYDFYVKNNLNEAKQEFEDFVKANGYDFDKIKILTSLIFLNMSPLHTDPFDSMLYFLGKSMLYKSLNKREVKKSL